MKKFALPLLALTALLLAACAPAAHNSLDPASTTYSIADDLFSADDRVEITTTDGLRVYDVEPPLLTLGDSLVFSSVQGERLGRIDKRILSLNPTYVISKDGAEVASLSRDVVNAVFQGVTGRNTGDSYNVELADGSPPLEVRGDLFDSNYAIFRDGVIVADVYKPGLSFTNRYLVEVVPGQDDVLILEVVIALNALTN